MLVDPGRPSQSRRLGAPCALGAAAWPGRGRTATGAFKPGDPTAHSNICFLAPCAYGTSTNKLKISMCH